MSNPTRLYAVVRNGVTDLRVRMLHVMETGLREDPSGARVPAHYITEVTARHKERVVLSAQFGSSVSTNPYIAIRFQGGVKGDKVSVSWLDNKGETRTDEVEIA